MPDCTAQTNEANAVTQGFLSLGDVDVWLCLCAALSVRLSNMTAATAMSAATSAGYQSLTDVELEECILSYYSF